jgi:putative ABC transport system substrate-binding protein
MEEYMTQYNKFIQSLADAKADAIVVNTDTDAATIRPTIGDIPVVFARSDDPVATGAVKSLLTPGGFSTGIITNKPHERRLQILTEMKPTTKKIYYLYSPLTQEAQTVLQQVQAVGKQLNVEIVPAAISDPKTMTDALENTPADVDWFFLTPYVFFDPASFQKLIELSISHHAGICGVTDLISPGYLMGYGPSLDDTGRQAAQILDRILRGASPADLPVETAENYLTVNLEAAQAIDLKLPLEILRQANLIIRPGDFAKTPMPNASEATATASN